MEILLILLLIALIPFGVVIMLPPGRVVLIGIGVVILAILGLGYLGTPGRGSSDAAGYGMELGYHSMMVWTAILGAVAGGIVQGVRHVMPGLSGFRSVVTSVAVFFGVLLFALLVVLMRP